jgi:periplasmic mercuric ion binding protein
MKLIIILFFFFTLTAYADNDTLRVKTSAVCETCKEALEHNLSFEKGVKSSHLDLDTKIITVVYNNEKTNPEKIKTAIVKTGYDADSLKADERAFKKLPECCKHPELMK